MMPLGRRIILSVYILSLCFVLLPHALAVQRPVATYSIVACDTVSGLIGVAVQSHWFSVGSVVPWAEAGVGAVATQSFVKIDYGPEGLALLRHEQSASLALAEMLAADSGRAVRQVAIVDANGNVATHTGKRCIAYAGHIIGPGYSVQANLMADSTVPRAMADAFQSTKGGLPERMLAALQAAQDAGGDIRGRQSAAIVIVDRERHVRTWEGRMVDLRVDDHPHPVAELKRLYQLQKAYDWMNRGDVFSENSRWDSAAVAYGRAESYAPQIIEIPFWRAVSLASHGQLAESLPIFKRVFSNESRWMDVIPRLVSAGLLPNDSTTVRAIQTIVED